ncbi:hypothetical protein SAM19_04927 [Brevibacillus laterosporus]|nr:hypothetical protein [Brevibacillus laterosporus]
MSDWLFFFVQKQSFPSLKMLLSNPLPQWMGSMLQ